MPVVLPDEIVEKIVEWARHFTEAEAREERMQDMMRVFRGRAIMRGRMGVSYAKIVDVHRCRFPASPFYKFMLDANRCGRTHSKENLQALQFI